MIVDMQVEGASVIGNIHRLLERFRAVNERIIHVLRIPTQIATHSVCKSALVPTQIGHPV
ncbi:MAG TPA: hypothetical protein VNO50_14095 [Pyrinomonadaceae bacterium]|nr:hypothetical protein [Pyrinomonadaceae bacterium]